MFRIFSSELKIFNSFLMNFSTSNKEDSFEYIKLHAQETDRHIIDAHINLYVKL